ncbi:MAG: hypothetical protein IJX88_02960 [Clostridia bacterium]|nr:hypothetical protein [Clostridia bacterium]
MKAGILKILRLFGLDTLLLGLIERLLLGLVKKLTALCESVTGLLDEALAANTPPESDNG